MRPAKEHWLVRLGIAVRTGPGDIRLREGMNSSWSGSNWRFTRPGAFVLFSVSFVGGVAGAVVGRGIWTRV